MKKIMTIILAISFSNLFGQVDYGEMRNYEIMEFDSSYPTLEVIKDKFLKKSKFTEFQRPDTIYSTQITRLEETKLLYTKDKTLDSKNAWKIITNFKELETGDLVKLEYDLFLWKNPIKNSSYIGYLIQKVEGCFVNGSKHIEKKSPNAKPISFAEFKQKVPIKCTEDSYNNTIELIKSISPIEDYRIVVYTANSWCPPCIWQLEELSYFLSGWDYELVYFIDIVKDLAQSEKAKFRYRDSWFGRRQYTFITEKEAREKDLILTFPIMFIFKKGELIDAYISPAGIGKEKIGEDLSIFLKNNGF